MGERSHDCCLTDTVLRIFWFVQTEEQLGWKNKNREMETDEVYFNGTCSVNRLSSLPEKKLKTGISV